MMSRASAAAPAIRAVGIRLARLRGVDLLEPDLTPVREDRARTETVVVAGADHAFEDDAVGVDLEHLPVLLLDQAAHAGAHACHAAAVVRHLVVEAEPSVLIGLVERRDDLALALDP